MPCINQTLHKCGQWMDNTLPTDLICPVPKPMQKYQVSCKWLSQSIQSEQ